MFCVVDVLIEDGINEVEIYSRWKDKNKMLLEELANILTVLFFWILFYSETATHTIQTVLGPL